jgi:hypothetical protein
LCHIIQPTPLIAGKPKRFGHTLYIYQETPQNQREKTDNAAMIEDNNRSHSQPNRTTIFHLRMTVKPLAFPTSQSIATNRGASETL